MKVKAGRFWLYQEQLDKVKKLAKQRQCSKSYLVRLAIDYYDADLMQIGFCKICSK